MHIIVTGGAGYIGSRLTAHLLGLGHQVTVIDRLDYGGEGLLGHLDNERFTFLLADLRYPIISADSLRTIRQADLIIHLAAIVGEDACLAAPSDATDTNIVGTEALLNLSIPVVFISTCSNYGRSEGFATEETPVNPLGLYAETKIAAEKLTLDAGGTVIRLATICGASPRMRFDLLVNDMARRMVEDEPITIYNPEAWRPFLHIADACHAIGLIAGASMEHHAPLPVPGSVWNVVGENITKGVLGKMACDRAPRAADHPVDGPRVQISSSNQGADDPRDYRVSDEKFRSTYLWGRRLTVADALREVRQAVTLLPETQRRIYRNVA